MSKTISSSTTGPVALGTADNPLYVTSTGMVTSTGSADGIDGGTGTTWTITNAGVVSASSAGNGVSLASSGIISNTGSISGKEALLLRGGGSVTNDVGGSISGLGARGFGFGSGAGVYITGGAGTVTNRGTISGVGYGVAIGAGGLVTNFSSITGGEDGVVAQVAATISNYGNITATVDDGIGLFAGGSVTNASGASITGAGTYGAGVFIMGGVGTVTNAGSITSPNHNAVLMTGGGSLSNLATGFISGPGVGVFIKNNPGTVTNAGFITGTGSQGTGVYLENGGGVTNTSTGTITGHQFGAFLAGAFSTLANYGSISGATYNGAVLGLGGIVTNAAGASISGLSGGVYIKYRAAGTITNSGNISATGTGSAAIDLADGGVVANNSNGSISGVAFGVFVTGAAAAITNNSSITSTNSGAVELSKGGSVTNSAGASIKGGSSGVYVQTGPGTITNSGAINAASAGGAGAGLSGGGTITNNSGGSISGSAFGVFTTGTLATVGNSGSISGSHGVGLNAGGSVTNATSASISGQVAGISSQGGAITLSNAGSISATAGAGADIEFGGSITNLAGATISGSSFGVFLTGGSGTVTNAGTISGGSYAVDFAGSGTNRLVVDPGAVFVGAVTGGSGTSTLELASGTGSIGGMGTGSFNKFQAVAIDTGGTWTLNGANIAPTVFDNGTAIIAGSLDVSTAIAASSTGLFQLGSGAMLEVAATGTTTQINFHDSTSELIIDNAALFGTNVGTSSYAGPQLQHFFPGDKIDLKSFSSTGVTLNYNASTGVLQVANSANQVASLEFQTSSLGGTTFTAVSDGGNGIIITDVASAPTVTSLTDVTSNGTDLDAGQTVTFTLVASEALTIGAGAALKLSNGATAVYNSSTGTFVYTVAAGQDTADLTVSGYSGSITDAAGNALVASSVTLDTGVKIDTVAPSVAITSPGTTTNQSSPTISGTVDVADAGATVKIYDNSGTTPVASTTVLANGNWSTPVPLVAGSNALTAQVTDGAGNTGTSTPVTFTLNTTAPTISSIATSGPGITNGNGDLNAGKVVTLTVNFSSPVTVNTTKGSPTLTLNDGGIATYAGASGNALAFSYTVAAGQNTSDLTASSFKLNGATIQDAAANNANLSGATNYNPAGTLQIDTTAPAISIKTIAGNNIVNAAEASQGFAISGATVGVENGQIVTVNILNSTNAIVDTYTTADGSNAWAVNVTSTQATALADGSYTVTANVSDRAGNPAPTATHALTVDEDKLPEAPALTIGNTSLTVQAGGSVALGITATPVDSDDRLSVTISGLPSYEVITAPAGDSVSKKLQSNGTYTWTITEGSSLTGKPLTGLSLTSNYKGTGHPVATLTVTASNITSGETATSASQTLAVTDPPSTTSGSATLDFGAALVESTTFAAGATGTGSVSGFGAGDALDLADIAFGANLTIGYSANAAGTGGTLSISDGTQSASIALFGQFAAAGFHVGSDAGSGTMVTYTPPDQRTASLITLPKS
jgi:hypothetical protein